ncbi:type II secretion system protein J [Planctomycetota bacterium]
MRGTAVIDMRDNFKIHGRLKGFSLAELLAAITIGSLVLVAVLGVWSRVESSAAAVRRQLNDNRLPREVLQRIAEDLDSVIAADDDVKITIANKTIEGYPAAMLKIEKKIYDSDDKAQVLEEIIWQSSYDYDSDVNGLVLYRSHSGLVLEDKLLDQDKEGWERELFVPICEGVTFFKIQVPQGESFQDSWIETKLPAGVWITLSFGEPFEKLTGGLDVDEQDKFTRAIAVDRTRKVNFMVVKREYDDEYEGEVEDGNDIGSESSESAEEGEGSGSEKDEMGKDVNETIDPTKE